jgi:hypothetical protein
MNAHQIRIDVRIPKPNVPERDWQTLAVLYIPAGKTYEDSRKLIDSIKITSVLSV